MIGGRSSSGRRRLRCEMRPLRDYRAFCSPFNLVRRTGGRTHAGGLGGGCVYSLSRARQGRLGTLKDYPDITAAPMGPYANSGC
jgi:hypothetical protein